MAQQISGSAQAGLLGDQSRPAYKVFSVTPTDGADLTNGPCRALRANVAGDIVLIPTGNLDSQTITITVAAGEIVPIQTRRVNLTSTTATGILALY